jgi:hypothetical protein
MRILAPRAAARIILGLVLAMGLAGAAGAWQIGNWFGRSVLTDTGAFAGCRMSASYASGVTLHFLQLGKGTLLIGISQPGWSLDPAGAYSLGLVVDGRFVRRARGVVLAAMRETMFIDLGRDQATRALLQRSARLSIADGARSYDFHLTSAADALARLDQCVRAGG